MIAAAVAVPACRSRATDDWPQPTIARSDAAARTDAAARAPSLVASPPTLDVGAVALDDQVTASVALRNDGPVPLEIGLVERSRFCATAPVPSHLPPGGTVALLITCRADLAGPLRERLVVRVKDPGAPPFAIDVIGEVIPLLAFDVPSIDITTAFGQARTGEARLRGQRVAAARLSLSGSLPRDLSLERLEGAAGAPPGVRLRCRARAAGTRVGHLIFATALEAPREIGLSWACRVKGTLTVVPDTVSFDLVDGRARPRTIEVRSVQPGFALRAPHVDAGPFVARLDPGHPGRIEVTFTGLPAGADPDARGVTGTLVILSNDRSEPRRQVPLLGFGPGAPRR